LILVFVSLVLWYIVLGRPIFIEGIFGLSQIFPPMSRLRERSLTYSLDAYFSHFRDSYVLLFSTNIEIIIFAAV
jgi:hypothetical protein